MSRITKIICDGCGREISDDPIKFIAEQIDRETKDIRVNEQNEYPWDNNGDYCRGCADMIIHFVENLSVKKTGKPASPNPKFEECPSSSLQVADHRKDQTIVELLQEGHSVEDIVKIKDCSKEVVYQTKYRMKKQQAEKERQGVEKIVECRSAIKTCAYGRNTGGQLTCDYVLIAGHSRGCLAEACMVYQKK